MIFFYLGERAVSDLLQKSKQVCNEKGSRKKNHLHYRIIFQLKTGGLSYWQGIWLGATDLAKEGTFVWDLTRQPVGYSNWLPGQPDNYGGNENCMHIISGDPGKWNDAPCDYRGHITMCEQIMM